ncbi:ABC transporter transmembrane region domain-containing protein [Besnoitia besnoiti]|uniref:ABC transporter transmembrane region domain-containing protein n=1 Tax=Besnoitia besnoiti TaxID=94643 RepID=A0A2A9MP03_BESBE|nr:ABC transporter transmembrane region domain-containing protein [Besnoitia besnoiti]PFH37697.1 ABC transporter transmembrane region domain-containing protein [Besnoitia besnoiti]
MHYAAGAFRRRLAAAPAATQWAGCMYSYPGTRLSFPAFRSETHKATEGGKCVWPSAIQFQSPASLLSRRDRQKQERRRPSGRAEASDFVSNVPSQPVVPRHSHPPPTSSICCLVAVSSRSQAASLRPSPFLSSFSAPPSLMPSSSSTSRLSGPLFPGSSSVAFIRVWQSLLCPPSTSTSTLSCFAPAPWPRGQLLASPAVQSLMSSFHSEASSRAFSRGASTASASPSSVLSASSSASSGAHVSPLDSSSSSAKSSAPSPSATSQSSLRVFWRLMEHDQLRLLLAFVAILLSSAAQMMFPFYLGRVVDRFPQPAESHSSASSPSAFSPPSSLPAPSAAGLSAAGDKEASLPEGPVPGLASRESSDAASPQQAIVLGSIATLEGSALACGALLLLGAATSFLRLYLLETTIERTAARLRQNYFSHLLREPTARFTAESSGVLVNRLSTEITQASRILIDVSFGLRCAISASIGLAAASAVAPASFLCSLLLPIVGAGFVLRLAARRARQLQAQQAGALGSAMNHAAQVLQNRKAIRAFNAEDLEVANFRHALDSVYKVARRNAAAVGARHGLVFAIGGGFLLHVIQRCGSIIASGGLSLGDVTALAMYCVMAGSSLQGCVTAYGDIQRTLGNAEKVLGDLAAPDEPSRTPAGAPKAAHPDAQGGGAGTSPGELRGDSARGSFRESATFFLEERAKHIGADMHALRTGRAERLAPLEAEEGAAAKASSSSSDALQTPTRGTSVTLTNVHFAYPERPAHPVLRGLDLQVPPGAFLGVLGASGSGKSTLAALLLRLYEPTEGEIRFDGVPLRRLDERFARSLVVPVTQENLLLSTSVRDNIEYAVRANDLLSDSCASPAGALTGRAKTACDLAVATDFVSQLPQRLEAVLDEKALSLSGGQRQRIAIARALCRLLPASSPRAVAAAASPALYAANELPLLLLLDEATSALDAPTERQVLAHVKEVLSGRTAIFITHRLSVLDYVDYLAVLGEGRVVQSGKKEAVLAAPCKELRHM